MMRRAIALFAMFSVLSLAASFTIVPNGTSRAAEGEVSFLIPASEGYGVAEEVSDISLACRQIGPIRFKEKFEQGAIVFTERRSLIFKRMRIVRGCDAKRNVLVYMVYSDRPIEGSPKNSTSSVPIMPWGGSEAPPKCAEWVAS